MVRRKITLLVHSSVLPISSRLAALHLSPDQLLLEGRRCDSLEIPLHLLLSGQTHRPPAMDGEGSWEEHRRLGLLAQIDFIQALTAQDWPIAEAAWTLRTMMAAEISRLEQDHRIRWLLKKISKLSGHIVVQHGPIYAPVLDALSKQFGSIDLSMPPADQPPRFDPPAIEIVRTMCEKGQLPSPLTLRKLAKAGVLFALLDQFLHHLTDPIEKLRQLDTLTLQVRRIGPDGVRAFLTQPTGPLH